MVQQSFSAMYSEYYDLLYKNKDYKHESEQIDKIIKSYCPGAKSILNIGCGTGGHDIIFAKKGYKITGIDSSEYMLDIANKKRNSTNLESLNFICKDIREAAFEIKYDVAISLFHVVSYFIKNEDINIAFKNIYASLKDGGIFIFDFWYAKGIMNNLPEKRKLSIEENDVHIERFSDPKINTTANLVDIKFTLKVKNIQKETFDSITEIHKVRYFSLEEMTKMLNSIGFTIVSFGSDYEFNSFDSKDRYATIIAKK